MNPSRGAVIKTGRTKPIKAAVANAIAYERKAAIKPPTYSVQTPATVSPLKDAFSASGPMGALGALGAMGAAGGIYGNLLSILGMNSVPNTTPALSTMTNGLGTMGMNSLGLQALFGNTKEQEYNQNAFMATNLLKTMTPVKSPSIQAPAFTQTVVKPGPIQRVNTASNQHQLTAAIMQIASAVPDGFSEPENSESCSNSFIKPVCKGHNTWNKQHNFDSWCSKHCPIGQCPQAVCTCSCLGQMVNTGMNMGMPSQVPGALVLSRCKSVPVFGPNPSMDQWCAKNCIGDNCPGDFCFCE